MPDARPPSSSPHPIPVVPEPVHATPADLPPVPPDAMMPGGTLFDPTGPWWEPGPWEIAKGLGWRWIIIIGILGLIGLLVTFVVTSGVFGANALAGEIKLLIFLVGGGIVVVGNVIKKLVKERADTFCIHCGYSLQNMAEVGRCPECGRGYHRAVVLEYKKDPHFFQARYQALRRMPPAPAPFAAGLGPTESDGTD